MHDNPSQFQKRETELKLGTEVKCLYKNTQFIFLWIYNRNVRNNSPHLGIITVLQIIRGLNPSVDCDSNYWVKINIYMEREEGREENMCMAQNAL